MRLAPISELVTAAVILSWLAKPSSKLALNPTPYYDRCFRFFIFHFPANSPLFGKHPYTLHSRYFRHCLYIFHIQPRESWKHIIIHLEARASASAGDRLNEALTERKARTETLNLLGGSREQGNI